MIALAPLRALIGAALVAPAMVAADIAHGPTETIMAPSGFDITPQAVLYEEDAYSGETQIIVRLIAPAISSRVLAANLQADMEWACETWGLPASDALTRPADRIVVEMMERLVPRGEATPDTLRFFESFSPEGDLCIWRLF
jgi:hypothetical protein